MKFLGIDVGTGGSRAVVIDEAGQVIDSATIEHVPFTSPQTGWAEQDPADWWRASATAIRAVLGNGKVNTEEIASIGLTGQMHGAVLLDEHDEVLRPAIIWCDVRTDPQCRELTQRVGADKLIQLVLNPALAGFTLPKLLWVREVEPELWARVRSVLLPKDYVRLKLTGDRATDVADASGTLLLNVRERKWSNEMLGHAHLDEALLPHVYESQEVTGSVSAAGAESTGLLMGTPVVAGAGDQAAGAIGMGIVRPGSVSATIGTSGVVFAATDRPALDPKGRVHTFCHAIPERWHVMGVTQAAGLSLRWFRDRFGIAEENSNSKDNRDPYDYLVDEAVTAPAGADGLFWAPYLMGERTPHLDPHARAALVGLTARHTRSHIIRAILEGVAFSLRDTLSIFNEMEVPVASIRLGGGGARSRLWQQIQADIYGQAVELVAADEGAAYGAALLAAVGVGAWASVDEACTTAVTLRERIETEPAATVLMDRKYQTFKLIYPALRQISGGGNGL
jgi:xylulokinase